MFARATEHTDRGSFLWNYKPECVANPELRLAVSSFHETLKRIDYLGALPIRLLAYAIHWEKCDALARCNVGARVIDERFVPDTDGFDAELAKKKDAERERLNNLWWHKFPDADVAGTHCAKLELALSALWLDTFRATGKRPSSQGCVRSFPLWLWRHSTQSKALPRIYGRRP
jgi:hypothetical protein